jgi:hypothetical protein
MCCFRSAGNGDGGGGGGKATAAAASEVSGRDVVLYSELLDLVVQGQGVMARTLLEWLRVLTQVGGVGGQGVRGGGVREGGRGGGKGEGEGGKGEGRGEEEGRGVRGVGLERLEPSKPNTKSEKN